MKLYGIPGSPYVQRVLIGARFKGHELPLEPPPGGMGSVEFAALSPMGRIPLLDDEGFLLGESGAIIAYLDEVLPGPSLAPGDARARARHRGLISLLESEVGPALRQFMAQRVFRRFDVPPLLEQAQVTLGRTLAAVERIRDPQDRWAVGDTFGPADALLVPMLSMERTLEVYGGVAPVFAGAAGLTAYRDRARADRLAGRTFTEMADDIDAIMARMRAA